MIAYEVFAIRYATLERRTNDNFVLRDLHDGPMPLDYFVWLIRGHGRTILVDTGFDEPAAQARGRNLLIHPTAALRAFGVEPDAIQDVILTHLHYDHAGNLGRFPNAVFHLQDAEMAYATGRCMCHGLLRHPYDVEDIVGMVRRVYDGRARFHDGDAVLADGISVHLAPGHTRGLQAVRVATARGHVVLASDASHFYANLERGNPFPVVVDIGQGLESHRRLLQLADSPEHIVPGHDPEVTRRYRRVDIEGIEAFVLHEPPQGG